MLFLLRDKLFPVLVFLQSVLCGCAADDGRGNFDKVSQAYDIKLIGRLDKEKVVESSGLELTGTEDDLWTHGDGGNTAMLYHITQQGDLLRTVNLAPLTNMDWEDLARDPAGNLYIGDFGNNQNKRRNLSIYRLASPDFKQVDTIRFRYPDQHAFPPKKPRRNFDCEAFYFWQDSLYLFTKNRGEGHWVKQYVLPARPGSYTARLADSIRINTWITAADISPDGQRVALLGYGHVYLIERLPGRKLFDGAKSCLPIPSSGQAEAVVFVNNHDFVFSNEKGKLYKAGRK
ncbi:hypothetical protein SAMN02745146_1261 [Hymenobacter daecheongensis DSM 21074]|uniref:Uncharacterized protein n=1 Tax=Hymenobacter daecheongensis DSM 21074 TaxID=1121955 RepID=A0A1M6CT12_9BACT|nr:hypothetical protein [Hymenobacter daecheongensis]SHI64157.1 hypothetical protein SAMN02745146_1261 [Hymenobacter daecheongensis DSM 21074]